MAEDGTCRIHAFFIWCLSTVCSPVKSWWEENCTPHPSHQTPPQNARHYLAVGERRVSKKLDALRPVNQYSYVRAIGKRRDGRRKSEQTTVHTKLSSRPHCWNWLQAMVGVEPAYYIHLAFFTWLSWLFTFLVHWSAKQYTAGSWDLSPDQLGWGITVTQLDATTVHEGSAAYMAPISSTTMEWG